MFPEILTYSLKERFPPSFRRPPRANSSPAAGNALLTLLGLFQLKALIKTKPSQYLLVQSPNFLTIVIYKIALKLRF